MKHCNKCNKDKPISEFYLDKRRDRLMSPCKSCRSDLSAKQSYFWRAKNPDKVRKSNQKAKLKRVYGLTPEELVHIWKSQDGACAICHKPISLNATEKASKPHVDHCHVTDVVRGLLCLTCNTGLGMFGDSENLLDAARNYLLRSKSSALGKNYTDSDPVSSEIVTTIH